MFSKLRLSQLLWLGYSLPLLLFLGLAGTIGISSSKVSDSFTKIDKAEEAIIQTDLMTISLLLMVRDFRGYALLGREDVIKDFEKNWQDFQKSSQRASQAIDDPEREQRLVQMNRLAEQWKNSFANEVINQTRAGKKNVGLTRVLSPEDLTPIDEFDRLNREFNDLAEQDLKNIKLEAKQSLAFLFLAGVGGAVLSIVLAAVVAYWISSRISKQINEETNKITSSATEIAATAGQQERVANQQAIAVNQTTTTMDELGASSQQSANQAEAAVTAAQQALNLAEGGTTAVAHTLEGMDVLKEKVRSITAQILLLSEQTTQISAISGLVSDLANQTNMLALNAAVEAVRAGEHGKGFAVVAAEIRKLADESKRSAEKIRILVMDTQNALNSTVMVTDEGTKTVEEGVRIAKTTAEAFQGIMAGIDHVVLNNKQISLNVKQQAIAIQQVVEAMNSINVAAQENSGGISQVKVGIQKLNDAAHNLNAVV